MTQGFDRPAMQSPSLDRPAVSQIGQTHSETLYQRLIHPYRVEWGTGITLMLIWVGAVVAFVTQWDAIASTGAHRDMSLDGVNEHHLLALIAAAGALGSMIHALTSFASYVGNGSFDGRWAVWYITRPAVGATLALCILPLVRAGFIDSQGAFNQSENATFTLISLAILVGMFSKDATDKLADLFSTILSSDRNKSREGKLNSQPPILSDLSPSTLEAKTEQLRLLANGDNFAEGSRVLVNGQPRKTSYYSPQQLAFWLQDSDVAAPCVLQISVLTQDPARRLECAPLSLAITQFANSDGQD